MPTRPPVHRPHGYKPREQQKVEYDKARGSAAKRGYDAAWRKLRLQFLSVNPLCLFCIEQKRVVQATVVDHIITIADRPDLRLEWTNLRPLCKPCHDTHTAKEQGFARKKPHE